MNSRQLWRLLKQSFQEWQSDRASLLAAALAYYTALAIAPILILVIAIAGFFLGQYSVQGEVFRQLQLRIGDQGAESRSEEHTSELQSLTNLVCRLLLEKKKKSKKKNKKEKKKKKQE